MSLSIEILGCGSSRGVPGVGGPDGAGDWGLCDPAEPRNRRLRCSALVRKRSETGETRILIDTSPDLRQQLLAARVARLDAVLITHDHADQTHGIDDLRPLAVFARKRVPIYLDEGTSGEVARRFRYCFEPAGAYAAILERRALPPAGETVLIDGPGGAVPATPFLQHHGPIDSLGFRCGEIAYSSDVVGLPEESFRVLDGVRIWVIDALQTKPHATHAHLDLALEWIARIRPERAILTNLHLTMDYATLKRTLPKGVEPAYDGMIAEA